MGIHPLGTHFLHSRAVCMVGEPPLNTRKLYALKCSTSWCGGRQLDPANCPIGTVLEFVQVRSSAGLTHSTLKAYVAALPAYRAPLGGLSVGRHPLVTRFLQRLRHPARRLMLCGGSGCYSIVSSPLLSPLGIKTHFSEVGLWDALLATLSFSRPSCTPFTLGRDLSVWRHGYLIPIASPDAARVPEEERLGLRM